MADTEHVRDECWDGGPALDIYIVESFEASLDVEPKTVNRFLGNRNRSGLMDSGGRTTVQENLSLNSSISELSTDPDITRRDPGHNI